MALTVPTYDTPQVTPENVPSARQSSVASPGLLGGPSDNVEKFGKQVQQAGSDFESVVNAMQDKQNLDMVMHADTGINTEWVAKSQELQSRHGSTAYGITKEAADWWDKQAKAHADNLMNDRQRQIFLERAAQTRNATLGHTSHWENMQTHIGAIESSKASIAANMQTGLNGYGNPESDGNTIKNIAQNVEALSTLQGITDPTARDVAVRDALTVFHTQGIQNVAGKDPMAARLLFEQAKNKDQINASQYDDILKMLDNQDRTTQITQAANKLWDLHGPENITKAEADAREQFKNDGKVQEGVLNLLKARYSEHEYFKTKNEESNGDQGYKWLAAGQPLAAFVSAHSDVWNGMSGKTQIALEALELARTAKEPKTVSDMGVWGGLYEILHKPGNQAAVNKLNIADYADKLTPADYKSLFEAKVNYGKDAGMPQQVHPDTIKNALFRAGLVTANIFDKPSADEHVVMGTTIAEVNKRVAQWSKDNSDAHPTDAVFQQITDQVARNTGYVSGMLGSWFGDGTKKTWASMSPDEQKKAVWKRDSDGKTLAFSTITPVERTAALRALNAYNTANPGSQMNVDDGAVAGVVMKQRESLFGKTPEPGPLKVAPKLTSDGTAPKQIVGPDPTIPSAPAPGTGAALATNPVTGEPDFTRSAVTNKAAAQPAPGNAEFAPSKTANGLPEPTKAALPPAANPKMHTPQYDEVLGQGIDLKKAVGKAEDALQAAIDTKAHPKEVSKLRAARDAVKKKYEANQIQMQEIRDRMNQ
jgi:hypothetical protein